MLCKPNRSAADLTLSIPLTKSHGLPISKWKVPIEFGRCNPNDTSHGPSSAFYRKEDFQISIVLLVSSFLLPTEAHRDMKSESGPQIPAMMPSKHLQEGAKSKNQWELAKEDTNGFVRHRGNLKTTEVQRQERM